MQHLQRLKSSGIMKKVFLESCAAFHGQPVYALKTTARCRRCSRIHTYDSFDMPFLEPSPQKYAQSQVHSPSNAALDPLKMSIDRSLPTVIVHAAARDINPKRQGGLQIPITR